MTEASQFDDRAAEELAETENQEAIETKQKDEENAERSKLGRKMKELEARLSTVDHLDAKLDNLMKLMENQKKDYLNEDQDEIVTAKTLSSYLQKQQQQQNEQKQEYEKKYTNYFVKIGVDDDDFDSVWSEMLANHNEIHTGDPATDARINYLAAQNALLKKPKNPLQGKGNEVKGVNTSGAGKKSEGGMPKLDPDAEEFVKRMKLSPEWVSKALDQQ